MSAPINPITILVKQPFVLFPAIAAPTLPQIAATNKRIKKLKAESEKEKYIEINRNLSANANEIDGNLERYVEI